MSNPSVHTEFEKTYQSALIDLLYQLADDELVMGHRNSEWLGIAPDIEEDVAFASIAQDEIGHAAYFFKLLEQLGEGDVDRLAYLRSANSRRNARFVEQENGDWAWTIVHHYMYDLFDHERLKALSKSSFAELAQVANKMLREEYYHLLHFETLLTKLAEKEGEARTRIVRAWDQLLPLYHELFDLGNHQSTLVAERIVETDALAWYNACEERIRSIVKPLNLNYHAATDVISDFTGRRGTHTAPLSQLINTMAEVYMMDPSARW